MGRLALGEGNLKLGLVAGTVAAMLPWVTTAAATSYPNDSFFVQGDQWALSGATASINAPQAWCVSTGAGVTVADIDTGADFGHPDLAGKLIAGARFTSGNGNPSQPDGTGSQAVQDDNGHGTMTTGIMVADTNNGTGIAAVAPDARALVVKVLDSGGAGWDNDVYAAIEWAASNGARVINLSLGDDVHVKQGQVEATVGTGDASLIEVAIHDAYDKGVAVALAAGNSGIPLNVYTATAQWALIVGAVGPDGSIAGYSSGASVYAPGGTGNGDIRTQVVSTYLDTSTGQHAYAYGSGTSFATPQVAGVLAQLMARGFSNAAAEKQIRNTAVNRGGALELDAARALGAGGPCGRASASAHTPGGAPAPAGGSGPGGGPGSTTPASPSASASPGAASTPAGGPGHPQGNGVNALTPAPGPAAPDSPVGLAVGVGAGTLLVAAAVALRGRLIKPPR